MENKSSNIKLIDGRMVNIDELTSEEIFSLSDKIDDKIKMIEEELKKIVLDESEEN